uniref:HMG box domain-containing protein n=1 Tax=Strigamia maritima TaxID=126957 RepID=T1IZV4_STRMM
MWQAMPLSEKKPWKQQANILMEEYQPEIILPRRKPHTMWSAVTKLTDMEVFKDSVDDGMSKTIFYLKSPIKPEEFLYFIHAETSSPINDQESNSPPEVILPHLMGTEMEQNDESDDLDSRSHDAEPSDMFEDIESMNETLKMEIEIEPNDEFDDKDSSNHDVVEREINIEMKRMSESLSGISRSGRVRKQTIKYEDFEMFESCAKNDTYSVLDHDYCIVQTSKPHTDSHSKGRPMTAYTLWCRDHRPRVVAENPDLDFSGISVRLGEIWQAIPLSEKSFGNNKRTY